MTTKLLVKHKPGCARAGVAPGALGVVAGGMVILIHSPSLYPTIEFDSFAKNGDGLDAASPRPKLSITFVNSSFREEPFAGTETTFAGVGGGGFAHRLFGCTASGSHR